MSTTVTPGFNLVHNNLVSARVALRNGDAAATEQALLDCVQKARSIFDEDLEAWDSFRDQVAQVLNLSEQGRTSEAMQWFDRQLTQFADLVERDDVDATMAKPPLEPLEPFAEPKYGMSLLDLRISQRCQQVFNGSVRVDRASFQSGLIELQQLIMGSPIDDQFSESELLAQHLQSKGGFQSDECFADRLCDIHLQPNLRKRLSEMCVEKDLPRLELMTNALIHSIEIRLECSPDPIPHFHVAQVSWLVALYSVFLKSRAPEYARALADEVAVRSN